MKPDWFKLLYSWRYNQHPPKFGLTIPYLIGAVKKHTVQSLLNEINDFESEETFVLQPCWEIRELVLSIDNDLAGIPQKIEGLNNLIVDDKQLDLIDSFEQMTKFLEEKYAQVILLNTFSKDSETFSWQPFTKDDITFIRSTLSGEMEL